MNSPITASYPALRGSMFAGRGGCTVASYPGRSVASRAHLTIASPALAVKSQTRRHSARTSRRRPSEYGHTASHPNKLCVPASTPAPPAPPVENSPRAAGARHPPEPGSVRFHTNALRALTHTIARLPRADAHPSVCMCVLAGRALRAAEGGWGRRSRHRARCGGRARTLRAAVR